MTNFVVAVDGPAGSGKSSVSRMAAQKLGFDYLDTGAGYRAFTYYALTNPNKTVADLIESFNYEISLDPVNQWLKLSSEIITEIIRTPMVAEHVSEYARNLEVRTLQIRDAQSRILQSQKPGIVVEGRDITTVVAPNAQVRVLLTASESARLRRRGLEETESAENLRQRDISDSKVAQFLDAAPGVSVLDTTDLDFDQSVAALVAMIEKVRNV